MSRQHVDHGDIARFADEKVNLPRNVAKDYREQVQRLRDKLEGYIREHPDFTLKKMLLSGSLAKGTALRSLNDIDVAAYVSGPEAPHDIKALIEYLTEKLRKAFPNFKPEQVQPQTYSVTVNFISSGLAVDVVPVLYYGDKEWRGDLVSQEDGSLLETSIPLHLEFIRKRKDKQEFDFAQVVRLAKFWAKRMKMENKEFRFKSFMIELILSKLCDDGVDFGDYPEALQGFFTWLARTNLSERVVFTDHYGVRDVPACSDPVQIFDPINAKNNVAQLYTRQQANLIVQAALDAGDAIDAALRAPNKELTVHYWQRVLGTTFQP